MRIFLYEFVTGGGWYTHADKPAPESLLAEGRAMLQALVTDFTALADVAVDVFSDSRYPLPELPGVKVHPITSAAQEQTELRRLAREADWTLLIAPEFRGHLLARTRTVERARGRLLCPSSQVVALASDKQATVEHLSRHGVPVTRGVALEPGEALPVDFDYPAVLKPRDGAGSIDIEWLPCEPHRPNGSAATRLEVFQPGLAASVAVLCGPADVIPLVPCEQWLAGNGDFAYQGGRLPLEPMLAARARRLALRAIRALPEARGYVGVDLILGDDPAGSGDVVVEINPRLTTSYVGLRAATRDNLAAAMLHVALGDEITLDWRNDPLEFTSSGEVSHAAARYA